MDVETKGTSRSPVDVSRIDPSSMQQPDGLWRMPPQGPGRVLNGQGSIERDQEIRELEPSLSKSDGHLAEQSFPSLSLSQPLAPPNHAHDENYQSMDVESSATTLGSLRAASTLSKDSPQSSHTSADYNPPRVKLEENTPPMHGVDEALSLHSGNSSELSPARSTTPLPTQAPPVTPGSGSHKKRKVTKEHKTRFSEFRPRTSIPTNISHEELARQSIEAALASRLNPFALHLREFELLDGHICKSHVTAYLSIRNRILRLWVRNPLVTVTPDEAAGCALSSKWLGLAEMAYEWLLRNGYINFGCVEVPELGRVGSRGIKKSNTPRKRIVIVGAGMAGLGCARQLEGMISHYRESWTAAGEEPPEVIILEGRKRIGGRIYSHSLQNQDAQIIPKQQRCTAEMGAHIIMGFDNGNPMNILIRGQLALHYHPLKDNSTLFDIDGKAVPERRDKMVERLFNDMLERASVYRHEVHLLATAEGDRDLIEAGKDPHGEADGVIDSREEDAQTTQVQKLSEKGVKQGTGGLDKLTGKAHIANAPKRKTSPAQAAQAIGWKPASHTTATPELDLDKIVAASRNPTLGRILDEVVQEYQRKVDLTPQDLRLLNWHYANLEYANAANLDQLSLGGWDLDIGHEFEGEHVQVVGGYAQVPLALLHLPHRLDLRTGKAVNRIDYLAGESFPPPRATVFCDDGSALEADHVVMTVPLGVLKHGGIAFDPPLPIGKQGAINRLGNGLLNKIVLVFAEPFWDIDQDMLGLLRDADPPGSTAHAAYARHRGRAYLFWNCAKTAGRPVLIGLLAGTAAHEAEHTPDADLLRDATAQLARMFALPEPPVPTEFAVTRWGRDRFARGTYSYVGARARLEDYELMAQPHGPRLHFAGEATCGTHPATVHGAYLSGLRAAAEVATHLLGRIAVPTPLVPPDPVKTEPASAPAPAAPAASQGDPLAPAAAPGPPAESAAAKQARLEGVEAAILAAIHAALGPRPAAPTRAGANPFLLYSADRWAAARAACDAQRAAAGQTGRAARNDIRAALGRLWRAAPEAERRPYLERTRATREANLASRAGLAGRMAAWDQGAVRVRREYVRSHPGALSAEEERDMWRALGAWTGEGRRDRVEGGYAESDDEAAGAGEGDGEAAS